MDVVTSLLGSYMAGAWWNCCCLGLCGLCTLYNRAVDMVCHVIRSHVHRMHVCFSCSLPPALFGRVTRIFYKSHHKKLTLENSPIPSAGTWTGNLSITSPAFYHGAIPAPNMGTQDISIQAAIQLFVLLHFDQYAHEECPVHIRLRTPCSCGRWVDHCFSGPVNGIGHSLYQGERFLYIFLKAKVDII